MRGILADINIQGQFTILIKQLQAEPWTLFYWEQLKLEYLRFADVGLDADAADDIVWQFCQDHELVLVTDNRNEDRPDSLGATIRTRNNEQCLPVFTIADSQRLLASREYDERVIEKLLDFLMRIDSLRGSGRLFLP